MKILGMALLMTFGTAFASTNNYSLKMDLAINGKHISSPKLNVEEGKTATVTQKNNETGEEIFFDVVTTKKELKNNKEAVSMKFSAGTIDKKGERHIQYNTRIIALENQLAKITQVSENGKDDLALSVIATKQVQIKNN